MDTPVDGQLRYGPAPGWAWAFGAIAIVAAVAAVVADAEGRLLAIAAAVVFAGLAVGERLADPRLVVDTGGVTVRRPGSTRHWSWDEIEAVRVDERSRWGRTVHALEVDAGDDLVVLGPRGLGADPVTAARRIVATAPAHRRADLGGGIERHGR